MATLSTNGRNAGLDAILALLNGGTLRIGTTSGNNYIYYKQDGTTELFTITAAESERTVS